MQLATTSLRPPAPSAPAPPRAPAPALRARPAPPAAAAPGSARYISERTTMSRRRKHLTLAMAEEVPPPGADQAVVRALGSRGSNIVEVRPARPRGRGMRGAARARGPCGRGRKRGAGPAARGPRAAAGRAAARRAAASRRPPRPPLNPNPAAPCQVEYPDGRATLVLMPAKFNKKLWVRRGGYLIVEESEEAAADSSSRCGAPGSSGGRPPPPAAGGGAGGGGRGGGGGAAAPGSDARARGKAWEAAARRARRAAAGLPGARQPRAVAPQPSPARGP
jgi:translation initiation factor IF-2